MSSCPRPISVEAMLRNSLSAEQQRHADRHLQECAVCRRELEALREEVDLCADIKRAFADDTIIVKEGNGEAAQRSPPADLAGFDIQEEIHRGGQGVVYKAVQHAPRRTVALKLLRAGPSASTRERFRFEREIELAASLSHPNIVSVYESGRADGRHYFAMPFVDGEPLDRYLARRKPATADVLRLFLKICCAVHYAHQRGVIHRDLKPGNILIDQAGEPHVLDFGLAKPAGAELGETRGVTLAGEFMGTLAYASPEQAAGEPDEIDVRTDVYSLGVILYEMIAGAPPYDVSGKLTEALRHISESEPRRPSAVRKGVDADLDTIALKALAKDKERRYPSAEALARDVEHHLRSEPIEARQDSAWYVLRKTLRRYMLAASVAALFGVLVTAFAVTMLVMYQRTEREATRAKRTQVFLEGMLTSASAGALGPDVTLIEVLGGAEERIQMELAGQPEVEAAVRFAIGQTYASAGFTQRAEQHLRAALDLNRRIYGDEHSAVANCLVLIGRIAAKRREAEAIDLQREALAIRRARFGERHPLVAQSLAELGAAVAQAGGAGGGERAEALFVRALEIFRGHGDEARRDLARCLHEFARLRLRQNRLGEAEAMMCEALGVYRGLGVDSDSSAVDLINEYAGLLQQTGKFEQADALLSESLTVTGKAYGQQRTPFVLWQVGKLRHDEKNYAAAEQQYRKALATSCIALADKYPEASQRLYRYAFSMFGVDGAEPAAATYVEMFRTMQALPGIAAPALASGLYDLGRLRLDAGDPGAAEPLLRESLRMVRQMESLTGMLAADAAGTLGVCLTRLGRLEEAESLLADSLAQYERRLGETHPRVAQARRRLAEVMGSEGPKP